MSGVAKVSDTHPVTLAPTTRTVTNFRTINGLLGALTIEWKGVARAAKINVGYAPDWGFSSVLDSLTG